MFSRGLREVVLIVDDVEASTAFYRDVVGLELQPQQTSGWAWFFAGDPERRQRVGIHKGTLLFENQPAAPGGERWGPVHYAFQVAPDELEDAVKHVRSHGIEVFGPHQFGDMADAYFFYDPDDNLVEFFAYVDTYQPPPPLGS